jgi:hypothetical protein
MTYLLPNEILHGSTAQQTRMRQLLDGLRTGPESAPLPDVETCSLPELLESCMTDRDLFYDGYAVMAARYRQLGVSALLPFDRVRTGIRSSTAKGSTRSYGGFHHPGQGYRHLQMTATITAYGDLSAPRPAAPQSVALDLLRSYAHDCLHYATFRRYTLTGRGQITRVQYGINFRHPDGRTYSAPDPPGAYTTRNLGIVMEGATDTEATTIARQTVTSMISGDLGALREQLDTRNGPQTFERLFRAASYGEEDN